MSSIFDSLAPTFVAVLGDSELFTYTTRGGQTAAVKGIYEAPADQMRLAGLAGGPDAIEIRATISFATADLPNGWGEGDSIQQAAKSWRTRAPMPDGHGMVRFELEVV